jgi:osmoprotectant transport system permease protein
MLTFIALGISIVLGLLLGIVSTRIKWLEQATLTMGNLGRTIPSLAVLALALPFLGIGTPPTILALVFIGTLPVLINTNVGISQVDEATIESARGMGMNDFQVLVRVEVPIATAVIMAGIRTSAVLVVASATLAAFIGGGGLGDLILRGHALNRDHILLAGAIPATLLAFYFEDMFGRLESWATPKGLKIGKKGAHGRTDTFLGFLAAVLLMPIVFGAFFPWESFVDDQGSTIALTGMQPQYRGIALTLMILGVILVMRPRTGKIAEYRATPYITFGLAVIAILMAGAGLIYAMSTLPSGHSLREGLFLLLAAVVAIAIITIIEVVQELRARPQSTS